VADVDRRLAGRVVSRILWNDRDDNDIDEIVEVSS
jgi:hypothetical protein